MAFDVSALSAYVNEHAMGLIVQSVAGGQLSKYANLQAGIKGPTTINTLDTNVVLQDAGCSRSADGTTTLSQRTITPNALAVFEDLCTASLEATYLSTELKKGVTEQLESIPFEQTYIDLKVAKIQKQIEVKDWTGVAGAGSYAGLAAQASAVVEINPASAGAIVAAASGNGIIAAFTKMAQNMDEDIADADDIKLFCGMDMFLMYQAAIADGNYFHYVVDGAPMNELPLIGFPQVTVVGTVGLSGLNTGVAGDVCAYLTRASNIVIGVDIPDEEADDVQSWFDPNTRLYKFSFCFRRGLNWAFPTQANRLKLT